MSKVAFIGLGVMGYPMAGHIREKGGHDLVVYNRTTAKADKWTGQYGGETAATPAEAAKDAEFVFICVGNDSDLREVTLGPDGAFSTLKSGAPARLHPGDALRHKRENGAEAYSLRRDVTGALGEGNR